MVKHSHLQDRQIESPPKRPKSAEGKTSANEQVNVCRISKGNQLCYNSSTREKVTCVVPSNSKKTNNGPLLLLYFSKENTSEGY